MSRERQLFINVPHGGSRDSGIGCESPLYATLAVSKPRLMMFNLDP